MFKLKSRSHQADSFFVMLLFFLFALTAFILVLIGVKQYKATANAMNYNALSHLICAKRSDRMIPTQQSV